MEQMNQNPAILSGMFASRSEENVESKDLPPTAEMGGAGLQACDCKSN